MAPGSRMLLWMDMEGVSQVTDYRETLPVYHEYWRAGRSKITADAAAGATGLLQGGAREVAVIDGHGLGWSNVMGEQLPAGARPFGQGDSFEDFDGILMAGFHARCGTPDGFMSHTFVPYLRVAINGELVTECQVWALRAGLPVLGVTGDGALGKQLDGLLSGIPFLGVRSSSTRTKTLPLRDPDRSAESIREFAKSCARRLAKRRAPRVSGPFKVSVSMPADLTGYAEGRAGLVRKSNGVLTVDARDWKRADPAIDAAMGAAAGPLAEVLGGLELLSEKDIDRADASRIEKARSYFTKWVDANSPPWED